MNTCLLQKEIAGLKLILGLLAVLCGLELVYILATGFPDLLTATERAEANDHQLEDAIFEMMLFGMLIGLYVFGQEREHKTIPFLDGLPVLRSTLFFHKFMAACIVTASVVVGFHAFDSFFDWMASDSLHQTASWQQHAAQIAVLFLLGYAVVGVSALISFARKWFPLLAGLVVWTVVLIRSSETWMSAWLDTPVMLRWSFGESGPSLPWQSMLGHLVIGTVGWVGAWVGFQYRDGFVSRQVDKMAQWRLASWFIAFSQLAAMVVWLIAILSVTDDSETPSVESLAAGVIPANSSGNPAVGSVGFGRESTEYYEVIYRQSQSADIVRAIGWLDILHEEVRKFLGDPKPPRGKIVLDTASPVMQHAAGQTNWTKIRAPLSLAKDDPDFFRTVRHETAHVYIEQLSGGRASDQFNAMRMFHEGLASLAELADDLQAETVPRRLKERWAAGVDSRGRVPFSILCDDARLVDLRDPDVVYPLGFVVAQAMLDAGGPNLPKRFLEALKVTPIPPGAKPTEVWRILLQKCNTSLDMVIGQYETRLDALAERESAFIESLPRLKAEVQIEGNEIVIRVTPHKPSAAPAVPLCMIQRDRFFTQLPEAVEMTAPGEYRLARTRVSGNKIRVLLGWRSEQSEGAIYEPWQEFEL